MVPADPEAQMMSQEQLWIHAADRAICEDWRRHSYPDHPYAEALLPRLALPPYREEEDSEEPVEFVPPRMSILYQRIHGPTEEMVPPAPEEWRLVERSIPRHQTWFSREVVTRMAAAMDAFCYQLAGWSHQASCRRTGDVVPPVPRSRTHLMLESSREGRARRQRTSLEIPSKRKAPGQATADDDGSSSSTEVGPFGYGNLMICPHESPDASMAGPSFRHGSGTYEVGSSS